jgi:hypothetical protein
MHMTTAAVWECAWLTSIPQKRYICQLSYLVKKNTQTLYLLTFLIQK